VRRSVRALRAVLLVVLVLSLLANAVFVGIAVRLGAAGGGVRASLAGALIELPRDIRRPFIRALRRETDVLAPLRDQLAERRAAFVEAVTADPFDRERAERAAAAVREATAALQAAAQEVLLRTAQTAGDGREDTDAGR